MDPLHSSLARSLAHPFSFEPDGSVCLSVHLAAPLLFWRMEFPGREERTGAGGGRRRAGTRLSSALPLIPAAAKNACLRHKFLLYA